MPPNHMLIDGQNAPCKRSSAVRTAVRLSAVVGLSFGLSACAIPPIVSLASLAADGVLLATTGKSKADHGLSLATGRDCETFRALVGENVCRDEIIVELEPLPADVEQNLTEMRLASASADSTSTPGVALAFAAVQAAAGPLQSSGLTMIAFAPLPANPVRNFAAASGGGRYAAAKADKTQADLSEQVMAAADHKSADTFKQIATKSKTEAGRPLFLAWMAR